MDNGILCRTLHRSPEVTGCGAFFSLCTFMEMSIEARVSSFTN